MTEFYTKMNDYADEMLATGQPLTDEEFVAYLLTGLDEECYNPLVSSIVVHVEPVMPSELLSQMLSYGLHTDHQASTCYTMNPSANSASHGRGHPHGGNRGRDRGRPPSRGNPASGQRRT